MPVSSIFMPLHKNVMKFLRELCLVLTEICRSFIAIVTMKVRVCFPQLVTEIQFRSPYLFSIMQFLAIPLYQMWQFHYTKCGNSVIPNVAILLYQMWIVRRQFEERYMKVDWSLQGKS